MELFFIQFLKILHALNSEDGWTGDLTIADRHEIENHVACLVHTQYSPTRTSRTTSGFRYRVESFDAGRREE